MVRGRFQTDTTRSLSLVLSLASLAHLALEEGGGQLERVELVGKVVQAREELLRRSLVRVLNDDDDCTWLAKAWRRRAYELNSTQLLRTSP